MTFSQRQGLEPVDSVIETKSMSTQLKSALWNCLYFHIWGNEHFLNPNAQTRFTIRPFAERFFDEHLVQPIDSIPKSLQNTYSFIKETYFSASWNKTYEFLEWVLNSGWSSVRLKNDVNAALTKHLSGYRFIEGKFAPITNEEEISSIKSAISHESQQGASKNIQKALDHLSDFENPDYPNSIKESISAVESTLRNLTRKPTASLGDAIKELDKTNELHTALKKGFLNLYGYTSDEGGIRHGSLETENLDANDAIFFLVICSAFVNYLVSKYSTT